LSPELSEPWVSDEACAARGGPLVGRHLRQGRREPGGVPAAGAWRTRGRTARRGRGCGAAADAAHPRAVPEPAPLARRQATSDPKLRLLMSSMAECVRTIAYKVRAAPRCALAPKPSIHPRRVLMRPTLATGERRVAPRALPLTYVHRSAC
jgi:hypothetical protein